jgi:hypothetical protein
MLLPSLPLPPTRFLIAAAVLILLACVYHTYCEVRRLDARVTRLTAAIQEEQALSQAGVQAGVRQLQQLQHLQQQHLQLPQQGPKFGSRGLSPRSEGHQTVCLQPPRVYYEEEEEDDEDEGDEAEEDEGEYEEEAAQLHAQIDRVDLPPLPPPRVLPPQAPPPTQATLSPQAPPQAPPMQAPPHPPQAPPPPKPAPAFGSGTAESPRAPPASSSVVAAQVAPSSSNKAAPKKRLEEDQEEEEEADLEDEADAEEDHHRPSAQEALEQELHGKTLSELRARLTQKGLATSGNKDALVARLLAAA